MSEITRVLVVPVPPQVKVKCLCYSIYFARNYNVEVSPVSHLLYLQGWYKKSRPKYTVAMLQRLYLVFNGADCRNYALKPRCRELQGVAGILTHACAEASAICSFWIPALQKFAKDLICFIPYWDRDPQCVSKVLTCINNRLRCSFVRNQKL